MNIQKGILNIGCEPCLLLEQKKDTEGRTTNIEASARVTATRRETLQMSDATNT
jgi:hypothetical protein